MLRALDPELAPEPVVYLALEPGEEPPDEAFALVREAEGACAIVAASWAERAGRPAAFVAAHITLRVVSDLAAVGLTAAVSQRLAGVGVACNLVAGLRHDHLLVPWDRREDALRELRAMAMEASRDSDA